jgi:hypothetical protein
MLTEMSIDISIKHLAKRSKSGTWPSGELRQCYTWAIAHLVQWFIAFIWDSPSSPNTQTGEHSPRRTDLLSIFNSNPIYIISIGDTS